VLRQGLMQHRARAAVLLCVKGRGGGGVQVHGGLHANGIIK
jgi:hypothetical protein